MPEKCGGDVVFTVSATVPEIGKVFPEAIELEGQRKLLDVIRSGVYIVNLGEARVVGIKGPCPNAKYCERLIDQPCPIERLRKKW